MHYYKRNIGDYYKKAGRLTILQHGVYTLLIDACYDREKFPTLDEAIDWCWASSTDEIEAVKFVLRRFFELVDGRYVQARIADELTAYQERSEINRQIALEREAKKRAQKQNKAPDNPVSEELQTVDDAQQDKSSNKNRPQQVKQQINDIFDHWRSVMGKTNQVILTKKRSNCIYARLKEGYTVSQIKQAITMCAKSPYHMGQNDTGTVYDDITLICRSGDKIEFFVNNVGKVKPQGRGASVQTANDFNNRVREQVERSKHMIDD